MYLHVMKHSVRNVTYNIMFMLLKTFYLKSNFWLKCKCPNECVGYVVYALHLFTFPHLCWVSWCSSSGTPAVQCGTTGAADDNLSLIVPSVTPPDITDIHKEKVLTRRVKPYAPFHHVPSAPAGVLVHLHLALTQHLRQLREKQLVALDRALKLPGEEEQTPSVRDRDGGSGGTAGWLVTVRMLVPSPAPPPPPPSWVRRRCPWARRLLTLTATEPPAVALRGGLRRRCVNVCMNERVNVSQHCKALWIKVLNKWGPITIWCSILNSIELSLKVGMNLVKYGMSICCVLLNVHSFFM